MRSTFGPKPAVANGNGKTGARGNGSYMGPERRWNGERRQTADRRVAFRWEPGKEDRRAGVERRNNGAPADPWSANGRIF